MAALCGTASAQDYPNRPIRIIVPFSPGGAVDGPTRVVAQELSRRLKQQVIVENRPGAGATIGSELVAKSPADGYTLLLASQTNAISASLYPKLGFAPIDDFVGISLLGREPGVLVVHPSLPVKSVAELVAYAQARPGQLNYASSGNGSGQHLFMALFASMSGLQLVHVPYRGSGQATTDLLAGTVPMAFPGTAGMVAHIRAGKLRPLAISGAARTPQLPEVPTLAESGLAGYTAYVWLGLLAPKGTPPAIIERLHRELKAVLATARAARAFRDTGIEALVRRPRKWTPTSATSATAGRVSSRTPARRSTDREPRHEPSDGTGTLDEQADRRRRGAPVPVEKFVDTPEGKPALLFVHGSSMASTPTFDLTVPGRPDSSVMDWFAERGFVCWCVDMEGYGRSSKQRDIFCDIANGADDLAAATDYIFARRGVRSLLTYGISSGALRAALFAQRHPERVARLALDAFVWTGDGAPTLEQRRKKLPEFLAARRRPIDRAFVRSIFARDHPDCADAATVEAFADAILALDDSMPNGTYIDMCSKLPVVDPKRSTCPPSCCAASSTASPPSTTCSSSSSGCRTPTSSSR